MIINERYFISTILIFLSVPHAFASVPYLYDDGSIYHIETDNYPAMDEQADNGVGYPFPYVMGISNGSFVNFIGSDFLITTSGQLNSAIFLGGKGNSSLLSIKGLQDKPAHIKSDGSAIVISNSSYGQNNKLILDSVNISQGTVYSNSDAAISTYDGGGNSGIQFIDIKNSIINFSRGIVATNSIVDLFNVVINASSGIGVIINQSEAKLKADKVNITSMLSAIVGTATGVGDNATFGRIDISNSKLVTLGNNAPGISLSAYTYPGNPPASGPWIRDRFTLMDVNIQTKGAGSYGINMSNMNGAAKNASINTAGRSSFGVFINNNAKLEMDSPIITTDGDNSYGIYSFLTPKGDSKNLYGDVAVAASNAKIFTHGFSSYGVVINGYNINNGANVANVALDSSSISTSGDLSHIVYSLNGGAFDGRNLTLSTQGNGSYVAYAYGIAPTGSTQINLSDSKIETKGINSSLLLVNQGGNLVAESIDGKTYGNEAYGLYSNSERSVIHIKNSVLSTFGEKSGVFLGMNGGSLYASGLIANSNGDQAAGLIFSGSSNITTSDETKKYSDYTNYARVRDSTFNLKQGSGINIYGGDHTDIELNNSHFFSGTNLPDSERYSVIISALPISLNGNLNYNQAQDVKLNIKNSSSLNGSILVKDESYVENITLDHSQLIGDVFLYDASQLNEFTLKNNSDWTGSAKTEQSEHSISRLTIDDSSSWLISGGDSKVNELVNLGEIKFSKPTDTLSNQNLTVDGNYTGGGVLVMNGFLRSDNSDSIVDSFKIRGDVLGEPTRVKFLAADDLGMATKGDGIQIIQAMQASNPTNFIQDGKISAGAYDYTLVAHDQSGDFKGSWYLTSQKNPVVIPPDPDKPTNPIGPSKPLDPSKPVLPPPPVKPLDPKEPEIPILPKPPVAQNFRPLVVAASIVPSLANSVALTSLGNYQDRVAGTDKSKIANGAWGRIYNSEMDVRHHYGNDMSSRSLNFAKNGANYSRHVAGLQIGQELGQLHSQDGSHHFGVSFGENRTKANVDGIYSGDSQAGKVRVNNTSFGGYWTYLLNNGLYIDTQLQADFLSNIDISTSEGQHLHTHGWASDISLEAGYKLLLNKNFFIESQLQTIFQHADINSISSKNSNLRIDYEVTNVIYNRFGIRAGIYIDNDSDTVVYSRFNYWNTENNHTSTYYSNYKGKKQSRVKLHSELGGDWYQTGIGVSHMFDKNSALYASFDYEQRLKSNSGHGVSGIAGVKIEW